VKAIQSDMKEIASAVKSPPPLTSWLPPWLSLTVAIIASIFIPWLLWQFEKQRTVFSIWEKFRERHISLAKAGILISSDKELNQEEYFAVQAEFSYLAGLAEYAEQRHIVDNNLFRKFDFVDTMIFFLKGVDHQIEMCEKLISSPTVTPEKREKVRKQLEAWQDWSKAADAMRKLMIKGDSP
jgi:hypothetical protein